MSEPGFASLGPTLLARKGGAKPAMRPQVAPLVQGGAKQAALAEDQLEDLGWNDMGESETESGADIVPINADVSPRSFTRSAGPVVRRHQSRIEERVLADAAMTGPEDRVPHEDADIEATPARTSAIAAGRRAAFTLRLDAERHLKLRLAATMQGVSAQTLLTEALDTMLAEFDELDVIAKHLKRH